MQLLCQVEFCARVAKIDAGYLSARRPPAVGLTVVMAKIEVVIGSICRDVCIILVV